MGSNSSSCNNGDWVSTEKRRCRHDEYKKKVKTLVGIKKINYLCTDQITTKLTTKPHLP